MKLERRSVVDARQVLKLPPEDAEIDFYDIPGINS